MKQTDAPTLSTRRSVLAAIVGAAAAGAAAALGRPLAANAADGDPLVLGQTNQADTETTLDGTLIVRPVAIVENLLPVAQGVANEALIARSTNGIGVYGQSEGNRGGLSSGVKGVATTDTGVGVTAVGQIALLAHGKVQLETRSGRATVLAGRSSVDVDLIKGGLAGTPLCFANVMSYRPGTFVTMVRPNYPTAHRLRIYLNRAVTANTYVAWLVLN